VADHSFSDRGLWVRRGGSGERLLVLLHGMGANGAVWSRLLPILHSHWSGRVLVPDLRGHGRSVQQAPYGIGMHAADIAALIAGEASASVTLVGHSLGGAVAALVASGLYGTSAHVVMAIGVKICWTEDEIDRAREMARRPMRSFASREEAIERYLKISGLSGLADPASEAALAGIMGEPGAWRVAMDPRVYAAVGPSVPAILKSCAAPLHLAAGENDPMVTRDDMRAIDPAAVTFAGRGHNVHWEAPEAVWDLVRGIVTL
jgi:pimeloyl-ACP methyl ester carboxylesterase